MRKPQVTRTITSTECATVEMNVTTCEVVKTTRIISGEVSDINKALKEVKKLFETDTNKVVLVEATNIICQLYGMSEADFIKYAHVLDKR